MTDLKKYGNRAATLLLFAVFVYMLARPAAVNGEASAAVRFCLGVMIPSLFVNMALIGYLLPRIINIMGGRHAELAALVCGMLCGFPAGANLALALRENGASPEYADYINSFSNNASITFVVSFAGSGALKSTKAGAALAVLELVSSIACMAVMRWVIKPKDTAVLPRQKEIPFSQSVLNAVKSMAAVCGSVVAFSCIASALGALLPRNGRLFVLLKGVLEFSGGINEASFAEPPFSFIAMAMFIGWSGLCVLMQIKAVAGSKLKIKYYVLSKLLQGALMTAGAAALAEILY